MLSKPKDRKVAAVLAFAGAIPIPVLNGTISGLHKFYLGQPRWGIVYLLLGLTPISTVASLIEGAWYLFQDGEEFEQNFNALPPGAKSGAGLAVSHMPPVPANIAPLVGTVAEALRQLEQLRQEGLVSEYEFEQKRRQLLDRIT
ncbi:MAG: NINE protein [Timaviella obliquedivisa GSE-PSE-MK23-08B]|jgi:TM2 domain-containing membrane protein YozV|nr:NINE protein [Timaviella obliquedivisa GSE-PSE-MK23-08B]